MKLLKILCLLSWSIIAHKTVIFIPFDEYDTRDVIFAGGPTNYWHQLRQACAEAGYHVTTQRDQHVQDVYAVVAFNAPHQSILKNYPKAKKILYMWEPPTIHPSNFSKQVHEQFDYIATWHDELVDGKKYHKFNYALLFAPAADSVPFHAKKLCCMFVGNKRSSHPHELYSHRAQMVQLFEQQAPHEFDLYGSGWDKRLKTYRGFAEDKIATMRQYKFAIVYENMRAIPGYITEKIFDAFSAGCVPVYWGASNVQDYIPRQCFIAREDFASEQDVYHFLKAMSEESHREYLEAIRAFLLSQEAHCFSREHYIKTFIRLLQI